MGAGNVKNTKNKALVLIEKSDESFDSIDEQISIKGIMFVDSEELSKHENLLAQAAFCELPPIPNEIYQFEKRVSEAQKNSKIIT